MKRKIIRITAIVLSVFLVLGLVMFALVWNGVILLNGHAAQAYPVHGVDVSVYQGDIDWETLSQQNISFAFIKATEGSSLVDSNFARNFEAAQKTSLAVGAYHFFSYDSAGETQAQNFINTVTPFDGMLPPVVVVEFYGDKEKNLPDRAEVERQLKTLLNRLEEHYGQKPILYATEKSYRLYLSDDYADYDIWIRDVIAKPTLSDDREWTFWQYTNRDKLDGYQGEEIYIDKNVFCGSEEDFAAYLVARSYHQNQRR